MSRKQEWLVEVQIVELHAQIVEADSAEEARAKADANGWGPHTLNDVEPPEPFGDPIPRDDEDEE